METIAYPPAQHNGPTHLPPPEDAHYWRLQLSIEHSKCKRARWPPNPKLEANVFAYWRDIRRGRDGSAVLDRYLKERPHGSSTETT